MIILSKEDIRNPLHPNLWNEILETFNVDSQAEEICLSEWHDCENVPFFILEEGDIKNPLHPNLWEDFLETLRKRSDITSLYVKKSTLDTNKVADPRYK
jgi:hypothetical protein